MEVCVAEPRRAISERDGQEGQRQLTANRLPVRGDSGLLQCSNNTRDVVL